MNLNPVNQFAQELASNQPQVREKALKKIGKWFEKISTSKDALKEDMFMNIWKGLYFYYWHCDKMLVQEDRADVISGYIHRFKSTDYSLLYMHTFLETLSREWHGLDRFRMEKFLMLARRMLRQCYVLLQRKKWNLRLLKRFLDMLKKTVINPSSNSASFGLKVHICDIYMEELAKLAADEITPKLLKKFLIPYCEVLCYSDDLVFSSSIKEDIFLYLVKQSADEEEFHEFPVLKFKPKLIQKLILKYVNLPNVRRKNIALMQSIVGEFENYINKVCVAERIFNAQQNAVGLQQSDIDRAALELLEDEEQVKLENMAYKRKRRGKVSET